MKIIGLDLSLTATGWARSIDEHGTYRAAARGTERLHELYLWLTDLTYNDNWDDYDVDLAVIEGYAYAKGNQAHQIGEWGGVARFTLYRLGIPTVELPPAVVKKYGTGRGNATKADMRVALLQRTGMDIRDDNAVDALFLLAAAREHYGDPLWPMPKANVAALEKVAWPTL